MIEKDLLIYLQGRTALTAALGGVNKIVVAQTPLSPTMKLPWLVIEVAGGSRNQISSTKLEEFLQARITVECGVNQTVKGREIAEMVLRDLEHFRGDFGDSLDCYISCSSIRSYAGVISVTRYQFDAKIRHIELSQKPTP
jgi:hypothetical protein